MSTGCTLGRHSVIHWVYIGLTPAIHWAYIGHTLVVQEAYAEVPWQKANQDGGSLTHGCEVIH